MTTKEPAPLFCYVHGFGSTPTGKKAEWMSLYVKELFNQSVHCLNWHVPSFAETTTSNSLRVLKEALEDGIKKQGGSAKWNVVASSWGAYLIATLSGRHPELFNKIILLAPAFGHLLTWEQRAKAFGWSAENPEGSRLIENRADSSGNLRWDFMADLKQNFASPEAQYPAVHNPTVIVAAKADVTVPIDRVEQYYQQNKDSGYIVHFHKLPAVDSLKRELDHRMENFAASDATCNPTFRGLIDSFFGGKEDNK